MNNRAVSLSLIMALFAVFFVYSYVSSIEDEARKKFGTEVLVVKAKTEIKEQDNLNETILELSPIPKRFLEPAAIYFEKREADAETKKSLKSLSGSIALVPIRKGEQITHTKISEPNVRTGLAPQVTPGKRAVAIPVNDISGVSKLVKPGDRVDVIVVLDPGLGKENKLAKTLLQDVVVLAVGKYVSNNSARLVEQDLISGKEKIKPLSEDTSFTTVTLEVEPSQAQTLALVITAGDNALNLSLRNNDDQERTQLPTAMFYDVIGADAARIRSPAGRR